MFVRLECFTASGACRSGHPDNHSIQIRIFNQFSALSCTRAMPCSFAAFSAASRLTSVTATISAFRFGKRLHMHRPIPPARSYPLSMFLPAYPSLLSIYQCWYRMLKFFVFSIYVKMNLKKMSVNFHDLSQIFAKGVSALTVFPNIYRIPEYVQ